ncbi:unnamed protein product [Blepharisma stoltei]|uniref:Uncharacterized protein n=1 Tax=Blepharisma stoltei TaxID=1481888 RepID=A0AAU9JNQ9_9CILI|nr:unnamed protein product [Blepharisma stoltei]
MSKNLELTYLQRQFPNKMNPDPWNPDKMINCSVLVERYFDCVDNLNARNIKSLKNACPQMKRFATLCYKLEPKYFLDSVGKEIDEETYLNLYISKQLGYETKKRSIWKSKEHSKEKD